MKKYLFLVLLLQMVIWSCSTKKDTVRSSKNEVKATIDLVNVSNDKVKVMAKPAQITATTISYQLPKIIPGTYAIADYGRYVDDFKAYDKSGKELTVTKKDVNTWTISNANQLDRVEYLVNDTFDSEEGQAFDENSTTIFSPAGTNILQGENFWLNLCGFVGYFDNQKDFTYKLTVNHPKNLVGTTALIDTDNSDTNDAFQLSRYAEVVDSPIMYSKPDVSTFTVDGMDVYLHVYSPRNKSINSQALLPDLKKMITAQKKFLGSINTTKKYAILVYITSMNKDDARGLGALEHNNSTTATFKDDMKIKELIHVISHEFFHTLTPLKVHSKEIHYFDFNEPKMSQHLWMYEGFTEYFANFFQVREGLIDESVFYNAMSEKVSNSRGFFKDDLSFTEMSKNVLVPAMKKQYPNVYEKGALMAMCLDVIIREKSNGKRGILSVMGELAKIYGPTKPFDDDSFIPEFVKITYPEVGEFIQTHIVKGVPINYNDYMSKVGVTLVKVQTPVKIPFYFDNKMFLKMDEKKNVFIDAKDGSNEFIKAIGFENNDQVIELNGTKVNGEDLNKLMMPVYGLEVGTPFNAKVIRNGSEKQLSGNVKLNTKEADGFRFTDSSKQALNQMWLKG